MKFQEFYDQFHIWIVKNGQNYLFGLVVFFAGLWFIKVLRLRLRARMARRKVHSTLQPFFLSLTITGLYVLLIISVMQLVGFQLTIFTTIIGAFSVAAGLALSGTFQNFAGGVLILLLKPFDIDDNILAQGQDGKVTSIQIFYTVLLTPDNKTIIIPNGKLFNEVIVNVSREGKRRLDFEVKLAYANDVDKAIEIINASVASTAGILSSPAPRVGLTGLEIDSMRFAVNVWLLPEDFLTVKIALMEKIIKDLGAAGMAFPKAG